MWLWQMPKNTMYRKYSKFMESQHRNNFSANKMSQHQKVANYRRNNNNMIKKSSIRENNWIRDRVGRTIPWGDNKIFIGLSLYRAIILMHLKSWTMKAHRKCLPVMIQSGIVAGNEITPTSPLTTRPQGFDVFNSFLAVWDIRAMLIMFFNA